ncbi:threonine synthase [Candidatus Sumerlaeota bacterium]|nr:threonine synthase [Candidatus Sumerlaeota bacterium]
MNEWQGVIHHYREYLPVSDATPVVTLLEGNTPLLRAYWLEQQLGKGFEVYLKYEGTNPTCSFKDRGMTVAVSKAIEEGQKAVICASTGNTSASAAAYAARGGIICAVLIPKDAIALGKLAQALVHGATVIALRGNFDDALRLVREITEKYPIRLVNSINPHRIEGQKTASFEICDRLGSAPDFHCIPVGNAGNITAYWKGYKEYLQYKKIEYTPRMLGFQAAGAAPIVRGFPIEKPETIATAIRIGNPASWKKAENARDESGGIIDIVTDEEIMDAYKIIVSKEGIFCEPASAASVAGLMKQAQRGYFKKALQEKGKIKIVCTLTGHGLKDPDVAIKYSPPAIESSTNIDEVVEKIGLSNKL